MSRASLPRPSVRPASRNLDRFPDFGHLAMNLGRAPYLSRRTLRLRRPREELFVTEPTAADGRMEELRCGE